MTVSPRFAELGLAIVCLFWGSTFVLVKNALADISPLLFLGIRFAIATALLSAFLLFRRKVSDFPWRGGVITGTLLLTGYCLQTMGLRHDTTPAKSGFLTALYIPLVPLFAAMAFRKLPGVSEVFGVVLATFGMGLMTLTTARFDISTGDLFTIACAVAFAIHILLLAHYSRQIETEWLTLLQIGTCAVLALTTCRIFEAPFVRWSSGVILAITVTSVFATAVAFLIQTWAQKHTTATRAALVFSLEPVFAWLTSYVLQNEVLTGQVMAGAACILGGILLVELKPLGRRDSQEV